MNEHIYYHFWCLENAEIPYGKDIISDGENIYYHSRKSNDHKFLRLYRYLKTSRATKDYEQFTFELLNIYLNINYNEMNKNCIHDNALIWIHHTIDILSEFKEDYTFLTENAGKFVEDFKPKDKMNVKSEKNGVLHNRLLSTNDKFFSNFITVNVNIGTSKKNSTVGNSTPQKGSFSQKVTSAALLEMLKLLNAGPNKYDYTKICKLISALTGNSYNSIYNDIQNISKFTNYHTKEINDIIQIFNDLGIDIKLK